MTTRQAIVAIIGGAMLLAGCGKGDGSGGGGSALAAGNWPEKDACKALDKAAVAAAVGKPILEVTPGDLSDDANGVMTMCSWRYGEYFGSLTLMLRTAKEAGFIDSDIEQVRKNTSYPTPWLDVPGLGKAALWNDAGSLQVFLDDDRYFTMSILKPPPGIDRKAALLKLAKTIG